MSKIKKLYTPQGGGGGGQDRSTNNEYIYHLTSSLVDFVCETVLKQTLEINQYRGRDLILELGLKREQPFRYKFNDCNK